ncbi:MAG: ATP-binding cassette domain-containing protein, partial [Planctomycetota bacterium]
MSLLEIAGLHTSFFTDTGTVRAVHGLSLSLEKGEILGIVGESGSGKSVSMLSLMGLVDRSSAAVTAKRLRFEGQDLVALPAEEMRKLRGNRMAMIFQDPMTSL